MIDCKFVQINGFIMKKKNRNVKQFCTILFDSSFFSNYSIFFPTFFVFVWQFTFFVYIYYHFWVVWLFIDDKKCIKFKLKYFFNVIFSIFFFKISQYLAKYCMYVFLFLYNLSSITISQKCFYLVNMQATIMKQYHVI